MQDRPKNQMPETNESNLPRRRTFMLGNGLPVLPSRSEHFCETTINHVLDENNAPFAWFKIGMAAMVDMISRGTMDFKTEPEAITEQAWHDIHNVFNDPNKLTDVMKVV